MMRQLLSQNFLPTENRRSRTGCLPLLVICLPASASGHCHSRDAKDDGFWCDLNTALSYPPLPAQLPGREFCTIPMNRGTEHQVLHFILTDPRSSADFTPCLRNGNINDLSNFRHFSPAPRVYKALVQIWMDTAFKNIELNRK